jgi:tetratricopeptide (TPR) repeat protein
MALKVDPGYALTHVNVGAALLDLGERDAAIEHLKTAIRLDPRNTRAQNNLAVAYLEGNARDKGLEILRALVGAAEPLADAFYNLAIAIESGGDKIEAAKLFSRYLETDKESGWSQLARKKLAELR